MEFNRVATGIELIGTTIKAISVENSIVDVEKESKRSFGLNIREPLLKKMGNKFFSKMSVEFEIEIEQDESRVCQIKLSLEGAFVSEQGTNEETFKQLVAVNGAAAVIGIARGKIETISSSIFNNGKITIPFVNVVDYYKEFVG